MSRLEVTTGDAAGGAADPAAGPATARQHAETVRNRLAAFHNPGLARLLKVTGLDSVEVSASGCVVRDSEGREYLDFAGGYGVFSVGYSHPRVVSAVSAQLAAMPLSSKLLMNEPLSLLAERLAGILPGDLTFSFFCNSGAEAVEGAIKLARVATGRTGIVSTDNAFHGKTMGALSATGREQFKAAFRPLVDGFSHVPYGDAGALERAVGPETAAVILEPIQGEGGIVLPPDGYLAEARAICDAAGALLIADEIQTGLGRTGRMFAVDHDGVAPDIMTLAKGLGGGVMPIGAFCGTPWVWECFSSDPLIITSTFGGNPLACSAALAAIDVVIDEGLCMRADEMGRRLMLGLGQLQLRFPRIIADVRGRGLMIGLELSREGLGGLIIPDLVRAGILAAYTLNQPKVIRLEPPLVISAEEIDRALEVMDNVLTVADKRFAALFPGA